MRPDLVLWLQCPSCAASLTSSLSADGLSGAVTCVNCGLRAPVRNGIPRFVDIPVDETARRTQASFGYEWTHFNDWQASGELNFADYFSNFDLEWLQGRTVLDAGCGMGRHARQIAPFAGAVIAVDFSSAIDQAAKNSSDQPNVYCIQADLTRLPLAGEMFELVYSMGVLHHLDDTAGALTELARTLKPGGRLRLYLYWKRRGIAGAILRVVEGARKVTTRLPFRLLRALCWILSVILFVVVVLPYRALARFGMTSSSWPLAVYAKYPFNVLYNDQFDRFSAPLEKRYTEAEVRTLLESAGLRDVRVHARFGWIGDGIK
jgi:SAM-dependent methyltransferase